MGGSWRGIWFGFFLFFRRRSGSIEVGVYFDSSTHGCIYSRVYCNMFMWLGYTQKEFKHILRIFIFLFSCFLQRQTNK